MIYLEPSNEPEEEDIEAEADFDEAVYLYNCLNSDLPDYF
jgi:hypothetical protein